jgi:hypothetical protein
MTHLTLTKSKTSRISRPQTKSPLKKPHTYDLKTLRNCPSTPSHPPPPQTPKLEIINLHLPAGPPNPKQINLDEELAISDVLAGINYLSSIQFPPFPEQLGRDRVAELYRARKVCLCHGEADILREFRE